MKLARREFARIGLAGIAIGALPRLSTSGEARADASGRIISETVESHAYVRTPSSDAEPFDKLTTEPAAQPEPAPAAKPPSPQPQPPPRPHRTFSTAPGAAFLSATFLSVTFAGIADALIAVIAMPAPHSS